MGDKAALMTLHLHIYECTRAHTHTHQTRKLCSLHIIYYAIV